jgi:hypothetical protein
MNRAEQASIQFCQVWLLSFLRYYSFIVSWHLLYNKQVYIPGSFNHKVRIKIKFICVPLLLYSNKIASCLLTIPGKNVLWIRDMKIYQSTLVSCTTPLCIHLHRIYSKQKQIKNKMEEIIEIFGITNNITFH